MANRLIAVHARCVIRRLLALALIPVLPVPLVTQATASPQSLAPACVGDCDGDGGVTIAELITMVDIALNGCPSGASCCAAMDEWCNGPTLVQPGSCIITAVNNALQGCPTP